MNIDALQRIIHRLELGGGLRYLRLAMGIFGVLLIAFFYDLWAYKNFSSQEAMDSAQLARNIAQGHGYTTLFVRPFSLFLIQRQNEAHNRVPMQGNLRDPAQILGMHPDISNPPLYPVVLAGLMSVLPFEYEIPAKLAPFWRSGDVPARYQPDFLIAVFNQLLFLATVVLIFFLAKRLFSSHVAWLSGLLLLGTELLWRYTSSGLSTMFLLLLMTALIWCIVFLEQELREPQRGPKAVYWLSLFIGLLLAAAALTRYSFAVLVFPVVAFIAVYGGRQRWILGGITLFVFLALLGPWVGRNYYLSGAPFGTASYNLLETTAQFPESRLQRSLNPDLSAPYLLNTIKGKIVAGVKQVLASDLPAMSGSWASAFFLAGLFVVYPHEGVRRLRFFLVGSLIVLGLVQGVTRTHLSLDSPDVNSENLLIILLPFLMVYGANLFLLLLEQVSWPIRELRYAAMSAFVLLASLPLIITVFLGRPQVLAYPPYYPSAIQSVAMYSEKSDLIMSDIPWAVAWYGQSQSIWFTVNWQKDFFTVNDYYKSVQVLYLSSLTTDGRFASTWLHGEEQSWGRFILVCMGINESKRAGPPPGFPLAFWQDRILTPQGQWFKIWPDMFILTARPQPARSTLNPTSGSFPGFFGRPL